MNKAVIYIQNLKCGGCEATIIEGLSDIKGVEKVELEHADSSVHFFYHSSKNLEDAQNKLRSMGYPPVDENNSLGSKAQSYVSCLVGKIKT